MDPSLNFSARDVEEFIMSMEKDNSGIRSGGEKRAQHRRDVRIQFEEFNRAMQQYRRRAMKTRARAPGAKSVGGVLGARGRAPVKLRGVRGRTRARKQRERARRAAGALARSRGVSVEGGAAQRRVELARRGKEAAARKAALRERQRLEAHKESAHRNLQAHLEIERRKRQKLARKLAKLTLSAVESEVAAVTAETVPDAGLVQAVPKSRFLEREAAVEAEYAALHKQLQRCEQDTRGGTSNGLYFGTYDRVTAEKRAELEAQGRDPAEAARLLAAEGVVEHRGDDGVTYARMKFSHSTRRLEALKLEYGKTCKALNDASREVELGKLELEQRGAQLKNAEYKVKTLLRLLQLVLPSAQGGRTSSVKLGDAGRGSGLGSLERLAGAQPGPEGGADESGVQALLHDAGEEELARFVDARMEDISKMLPLWSHAFNDIVSPDEIAAGSPGREADASAALAAGRVRAQLESYLAEHGAG
jgi:hypothetical protein